MTINQVLDLDCREEESKEVIQKYLKKIKPLSKYGDDEDVPYNKVEKVITILSKKYDMRVREIVPDVWSGEDGIIIWRVTLIDNKTLYTLGIIYGLSLYEVLAKLAIFMYYIKDKKDKI